MDRIKLASAREHYDREGYVAFEKVLDDTLVNEAQEHLNWLIKKYPDTRPELLDTNLVAKDPFWLRLVSDERLLDIAEQFIGPNIALFASHYICKPAHDGKKVLWHQDGSYWPLDPMEVVTLWLAVDESTTENGCLRIIPRTHTMELQELKESPAGVDAVLSGETSADLFDESSAVNIILQPGGVSVHHPNVIHGSEANRSPKRRGGLTIRYIPTTTRITVSTAEKPWPSAFLLRGHAVQGINHYQALPSYVEGEHMPFRGCESWGSEQQSK